MRRKGLAVVLFLILTCGFGQTDSISSISVKNENTVLAPEKHSPKKAFWMSAAIPGLGQAYNKKYWKVPIIYALGGTFYYFYRQNRLSFLSYKESLEYISGDSLGSKVNHYPDIPNPEKNLPLFMDEYRRWRDLNFIFLVVTYFLNTVDATVDAYLIDFDVNESLSLKMNPSINYYNGFSSGFTLQLTFKNKSQCSNSSLFKKNEFSNPF